MALPGGWGPRKCPECGAEFRPVRQDHQFCNAACGRAHDNRGLKRAVRVYRDLVYWRASKDSRDPARKEKARQAFAFLCRELAEWKAEDRAVGREVAEPNFMLDRGHERVPRKRSA